MTPEESFKTAISLVPNWYQAQHATFTYDVPVGAETFRFRSHRRLTPKLDDFYKTIRGTLPAVVKDRLFNMPSYGDVLQELLAIAWLKQHTATVQWAKIISYLNNLAKRTYENQPVTVNMIIRPLEDGKAPLETASYQKFLDQLATSPFTYFIVCGDMKFMGYEQVSWDDVKASSSYKFHPEFLHPIHCALKPKEYSVHVTSQRDIVIMDKDGLLAAKRKGQWKVYDKATFKNAIGDCAKGNYPLGCNIFEILFDLSFKRHGALLVYDPQHSVKDQVNNSESMLHDFFIDESSGQWLVGTSVDSISFGKSVGTVADKKRLLLEVASIDGAVIFDDTKILAVGAVIKPHPEAGDQKGTRTTAALSAYHWGGYPFKVSSDGQVTIYFTSEGKDGKCLATMDYL